jgi:hypothetical protein
MSEPLFDLETVFATSAPHTICCECCEGYCPLGDGDESDEWRSRLWTYDLNGVEYLTDRFLMIRRDLIGDASELPDDLRCGPDVPWMSVPDAMPPLSAGAQGPYVLDLCEQQRITRHEHDTTHGVTHLYRGDMHIGWTTIASKPPFITEDDLPTIKALARALQLDLGRAARAYALSHDPSSLPLLQEASAR